MAGVSASATQEVAGAQLEAAAIAEDQQEQQEATEARLQLSIIKGGSGTSLANVALRPAATVRELRETIDAQLAVGQLAYALMSPAHGLLDDSAAALSEFGLEDGDIITLLWQRVRDYTKITEFDCLIRPKPQYPNGVCVSPAGELYVAYFFGDIEIYRPDWTLRRNFKIRSHPTQIALTAENELLVALRAGNVLVIDPETGDVRRELGGGDVHSASGLAVLGDRIFVSDYRGQKIHEFSLKTGEIVGGIPSLKSPQGLAIVEDSWLAVADRKQHVVRLFSLDTFEEVRQIGGSELNLPNDVCVDSGGNLLVMDTANERVAVFCQKGTLIASLMPGRFKNYGNTFSYLACNNETGAIAVSNNDEHFIAIMEPLWAQEG